MPWYMTPHGPHFVVEPGTIDEYERRDYVVMTGQQVTDYFAGVAIPDPPSFATEAEVPGIVAGVVNAGTGALPDALSAASVAAVEDAATVAPSGEWDFAQAPTVGGNPWAGGGSLVQAAEVVQLSADGTANSAAIAAKFADMQEAGKGTGTLVLKGAGAPIDTPLVFDLGYSDVTAEANWADDGGHRFHLITSALTPAPGIGTAITVRGGFGAEIEAIIEGGGQASDIGVHFENLMRATISVEAANFAGTVQHADASSDATKRIRQSRVEKLSAHTCGQALYWAGIEAFGKFDYVWDNDCVNGSEMVLCADHGIGHWESFTTATQDIGLDFRSCNSFQVGAITMGDRPSSALVRIQDGDFGHIDRIRASGMPGITTPTVTGVLLEEVDSVDIDLAQTFRCAKGLAIVGGGTGSIRAGHRSMSTDINPLHITAGTGTAPRIKIDADYRFHQGASVVVGPGLTGGSLKLSGYMIDMHTVGGASGKYAVDVDATSGAFVLDVAGLEQVPRSGMTGFTNHPTFANVLGVARGKIGNYVRHGADPAAAGVALATSWQNATDRTAVLVVTGRFNPDTTTLSGLTVRVGPNSASITNVSNSKVEFAATDLPIQDEPITVIVPPYWYARFEAAGTGASIVSSFVYYL